MAVDTIGRLLDPFDVVRPEPANLAPEDDALFRHEYRRSFDAVDLHRLRNVRLTREGVFIQNLHAVSRLRYFPGEPVGPRYIGRALLRRRHRFAGRDERYVTAFNRWSGGNYFHWMCDVLPRVYLARSVVEGSTFVLPSSHRHAFVEDSLAPFRPKRVEYFERDRVAYFREVMVPGHVAVTGNYHEPTIRAVAGFLQEAYGGGSESAGDRFVYVTRRGAGYRHIVNEEDVIAVVQRHGFEVVANEQLSLAEQIRLYGSTRILIGTMGANLTNVMFMPPGSALLQLTREGDAFNHLYWSLASAKGIRFFYQHCPYADPGPGVGKLQARWNLTVDTVELEATLETILAGVG